MIPVGGLLKQARVQEIEQPSFTWKLDFNSKRITGKVDELEAIKQAVYKILRTKRFEHLIYTANYGHELQHLVGKDPLFVQADMPRLLQEALEQDDRIQGIEEVNTVVQGDQLTVHFTVVTHYGTFDVEQEVEGRV